MSNPEYAELREQFKRELEIQMTQMVNDLNQLIEIHDRYGDTIQKPYLHKARRELRDGLTWFDWERKNHK